MTFDGRIEARFTVPSAITISCTSNAGGPTTVTITAGSYFHATFATQLATNLNAQRPVSGGSWTVAYSTGASGTGKYTIAVTNGTYSITWTSTDARDLLGFTANIVAQATSTGSNQARGLWIPDCPINVDCQDTAQAPRATDRRSTSSPRGLVISHKSNSKYLHTGVRWSHVPKERVWRGSETITNQSWERFLMDAAWGEGLSWFAGDAFVTVYDLEGLKVGRNGAAGSGVSGWYMRGTGVDNLMPKASVDKWSGLWRIEGVDLETDG